MANEHSFVIMKTKTLLLLAVSLFVIAGCESKKIPNENTVTPENPVGLVATLGQPSEYFPTDVGRKWTYKIKTFGEDNKPLNTEVVIWPSGANSIAYKSVGIYLNFKDRNTEEHDLILQVKDKAKKQGPFAFESGVEVEILKDDLNIYGTLHSERNKLLWAPTSSGSFNVFQVIEHDPSRSPNSGPWGSYGSEPGYSTRIIFFGEKPGTCMSLGSESEDKTLFIGPEKYKGIQSLHFKRMVAHKPNLNKSVKKSETENYFESSFTEDAWYGRGVGLMYLEQKVADKVTMVWNLQL